jgi:hypothetical protein
VAKANAVSGASIYVAEGQEVADDLADGGRLVGPGAPAREADTEAVVPPDPTLSASSPPACELPDPTAAAPSPPSPSPSPAPDGAAAATTPSASE